VSADRVVADYWNVFVFGWDAVAQKPVATILLCSYKLQIPFCGGDMSLLINLSP